MDIAALIGQVARGRHGSRNLTQKQAEQVFASLLQPDADPLQVGAFLIAQRMKGETSAELAGFVTAARSHIDGFGISTAPAGAVDLPCYAGKRRSAHAVLIAALRMRETGVPVLVHGVDHVDGRYCAGQALAAAGIRRTSTLAEAAALLNSDGLAYIDLKSFAPALHRLFHLRARLGVRSFVNTVARLLNPLQCAGQLNGVFHTPYVDYMAEANRYIGQGRSLIFMGAEGEPELYADRHKLIALQQGDRICRISYPDAGEQSYPRERLDPQMIEQRFVAMLGGVLSGREAMAVMRTQQAIAWAASGALPDDWIMEG